MKTFVGITDFDWFAHLSGLPELEEVNFWQSSANVAFRALKVGEPFLFKLYNPLNFIVGGGFFAHYSRLPVSLAWEVFGEKNGAGSLMEMRARIEKYRRVQPSPVEDYHIGCILLEQPVFFPDSSWVPVPEDWKPNIVRGKTYDLTTGLGKKLWDEVQYRLASPNDLIDKKEVVLDPAARYGSPTLITPRLGQGSFRIVVTDAYDRRCAVTQERTLPALEAAHIKPFTESGPHSVRNGILLRSDIHRLFDTGYVTITPDHTFEVSHRIRDEFENGRDYYHLHGTPIHLPPKPAWHPSGDFITWHNENVYKG